MEKYTDNPLELETHTTVVTPAALLPLLPPLWSDITPSGAKTLAAQCMLETSGGAHCYCWNLGNEKAAADQSHCYLHGVWECLLPEEAVREIASGGRRPTVEEFRAKPWWKCASGKVLVVFDPPHYQSRFAAFSNIEDGAAHWILKHRSIARSEPDYVRAVNAGDCATVAHILAKHHYYNGMEALYAHGMAEQLAKL